jgi:hypothetical protein
MEQQEIELSLLQNKTEYDLSKLVRMELDVCTLMQDGKNLLDVPTTTTAVDEDDDAHSVSSSESSTEEKEEEEEVVDSILSISDGRLICAMGGRIAMFDMEQAKQINPRVFAKSTQ